MREHEAEIRAQVGEALPGITRHSSEQRALAVHDFIMRDGQYEVFAERVHEAKCQLVLMVSAMNRVTRDITQAVVHPAHIPLVVEAEPTRIRGARHRRKRRGLLGNGHRAGTLTAHHFIETPQKSHGFQILAASMHVGQPLARRAAVVAIEHRRHGINTQAVDPETLQPMQGTADQETANLRLTEIVNQRVPVTMHALARIGVLVERRAVEPRKAMRVGRKMCWNPVEQYTEPRRMTTLDKTAKARRVTMSRRRCVQADGLIAPGAVERMLGDRQEFHMREAELTHVRYEFVGKSIPFEDSARTPARSSPRGGMHFIDADRCIECVCALTLRGQTDPRRQRRDDAGRGGAQLGLQCVRICFLRQQFACSAAQLVLVADTSRHAG